MYGWLVTFNETSLPEKEHFHSHLNMEDITDADYGHANSIYKNFKILKFRGLSWFVCSKQYITDCMLLSWHVRVSEWLYTL